MAASSPSSIRVRLYFDYPPPAVSDCRMCWLLVDLNKCRVVADLESIIRDKFDFSRKNMLNLFIEDCYLPHTENIYVVRDNDSIRVKVDSLSQVNGYSSHPDASSDHHGRKRRRDAADEEEPAESGVSAERKKKKKRRKEKSEEEERRKTEPEQVLGDEGNRDVQRKKKKEKKRQKEAEGNGPTSSTKAPSSSAAVRQPVKGTKKPAQTPVSVASKAAAKTQNVASSDSSDGSGEEDEAPKKTPPQKPAAPRTPSSTATSTPKPNPPVATKPRPPPPPSSSSETDSSSDEAPGEAQSKGPLKKTPLAKPSATTSATPNGDASDKSTVSRSLPGPSASQTATSAQRRTDGGSAAPPVGKVLEKRKSSDSDSSSSEEEIKLVIKRPVQGLGLGEPAWRMSLGRGGGERGRGGGERGQGSGERGQGGGERGRGGGERGRGRGERGRGVGERGRGGAREGRGAWGGGGARGRGGQGGDFPYNYDERQQQPSNQSDTLTNASVVLQNPAERTPKRDYSTMPMLAAPPQVGQKIAFKLLELTENYTPEVSEYKEGKMVSFDPTSKQVELELLYADKAPVEPGKFDLVYENADGSATIEYAVSRGSLVTERWESLLEPRLII